MNNIDGGAYPHVVSNHGSRQVAEGEFLLPTAGTNPFGLGPAVLPLQVYDSHLQGVLIRASRSTHLFWSERAACERWSHSPRDRSGQVQELSRTGQPQGGCRHLSVHKVSHHLVDREAQEQ
jgi:hypothetical protein